MGFWLGLALGVAAGVALIVAFARCENSRAARRRQLVSAHAAPFPSLLESPSSIRSRYTMRLGLTQGTSRRMNRGAPPNLYLPLVTELVFYFEVNGGIVELLPSVR
jgi:hypothetical protein